jgi:hypothetical protein
MHNNNFIKQIVKKLCLTIVRGQYIFLILKLSFYYCIMINKLINLVIFSMEEYFTTQKGHNHQHCDHNIM